ncbi:MAG: fumarylacetoacetate hydrolase family protein [Phycisphaeraceae bacterium]|nr:fumarylacetoacetate hydrolase family protein [Phycisphaeraceae bacterium]
MNNRNLPLLRSGHGVAIGLPDGPLPLSLILGVGRNYAEHAREQGAEIPTAPMIFTKSPVSCCLNGDEIRLPRACADREQVDYEGELGVVIGRAVRDADKADALDFVLGYCCANDVSARWWQKQGSGGQFYRGKSFDTFCPLGPWVTPAEQVPDPVSLMLVTRLNGEVVQESSTREMIFDVATLIAELSRDATLPAGTVILTGTPSGVGMARSPQRFLRAGDVVEVEIDGLGVLRNPVVNA